MMIDDERDYRSDRMGRCDTVSVTEQMQVGDMMAFIQYTMQIIMSFLMICMISIMLPRAAVSAERVDEVLTSETKIHDPESRAKDTS